MPIRPTYPGVYIEEVPSGVRTITGVATSVAAFIGFFKRGPMDEAVHILSLGDFEREFGGLDHRSEASYAIQQFFLNGGTEAHVIRVAATDAAAATAASLTLQDEDGKESLIITAKTAGSSGNNIEVTVTHESGGKFALSVTDGSTTEPATGLEVTEASIGTLSASTLVDVALAAGATKRPDKIVDEPLVGGDDGDPATAQVTLQDGSNSDVLIVEAANEGDWGNAIRVEVDYDTTTPDDLFNLAISEYVESDGEMVPQSVETFINLSMDGDSSAYAVDVVNDGSKLVQLSLPDPNSPPTTRPVQNGTTGGDIGSLNLSTLDATHTVQVSVDGATAGTLSLGEVPTTTSKLRSILQSKLRTLSGLSEASVEIINDQIRVTLGDSDPGALVTFADTGGGTLAASLELDSGSATAAAQQYELTGGADGTVPGATEILGSEEDKEGLYALEDVDLFNLLCIPRLVTLWDSNTTAAGDLVSKAIVYCKKRRAFMIVDIAESVDEVQEVKDWVDDNSTSLRDRNAALYFPLVKIADPLNDYRLRTVAPSGTVAGLYSRTDSERGVWKAPAGTDATLRGVQALDCKMTDAENGTLNPLGINCVRNFPIYGNIAWGARTLRGADQLADEYKYIPVRRLALFIEESLYRGTQWVVFEPNDEPLWAQIRLNIGTFMHSLFRQGAFAGQTPKEAYLVKCDKETTTQDDVNRGIVNILVGFAPLKPAEFVIIKIAQLAGQNQA